MVFMEPAGSGFLPAVVKARPILQNKAYKCVNTVGDGIATNSRALSNNYKPSFQL